MRKSSGTMWIGVLLLSAVFAAPAQGQTSYTAMSLKGTYAFTEQGTTTLLQPVVGLGLITFDGAGGVSGSGSTLAPGVNLETTFSGTYTVGSDGSGTISITHTLSTATEDGDLQTAVAKYKFVILSEGRELKSIRSDGSAFIVGSLVRR